MQWLEYIDFSPTKTLKDLLPHYQLQSTNTPQAAVVAEPQKSFTTKQHKSKKYSTSAILGLHSKQDKEETEDTDEAYMLEKEHICSPIDIAVMMPLLKQYTESHWHKHHGLMAVIKQHPPTYNIDTNTLFFNIYNNSQQQLIQQKSDKLLKLLRTQLNNYQLKIDFAILAEGSNGPKGPKMMLTEMINKNPHLQNLIEELTLELEF